MGRSKGAGRGWLLPPMQQQRSYLYRYEDLALTVRVGAAADRFRSHRAAEPLNLHLQDVVPGRE